MRAGQANNHTAVCVNCSPLLRPAIGGTPAVAPPPASPSPPLAASHGRPGGTHLLGFANACFCNGVHRLVLFEQSNHSTKMGQRSTPAHKCLTVCKVVQTLPPSDLEGMNEIMSFFTPSESPHCGISPAGTTFIVTVIALVSSSIFLPPISGGRKPINGLLCR